MGIGDYIALGLILVILSSAIIYVIKQKKKGVKCIGCPHACTCSAKNKGDSLCNGCCDQSTKNN